MQVRVNIKIVIDRLLCLSRQLWVWGWGGKSRRREKIVVDAFLYTYQPAMPFTQRVGWVALSTGMGKEEGKQKDEK